MSRTIGLKGGPELMQFLDQLPPKLEKNVLRGALRAGANVIRDEARANVPVKSGKLRRAIKTDTVTDGGLIKARVKLRGQHSFIGVFLEYGVAPHLITAGDSPYTARTLNSRIKKGGFERRENGLLKIFGYEYDRRVRTKNGTEVRSMTINKHFVRGAVEHPGVAARPFLRPALDTRANEALRAVGAYMEQRLRIGDFSAPALEVDD